jgi:DNA polymerase I-like protein with 3'-5' exonuclease and polymerase domains
MDCIQTSFYNCGEMLMSSIDTRLLFYNALDSACTKEIEEAIMPDVDKYGYRWAYDFTLKLFEPLMFMQQRGIRVNFGALEETKREIIIAQEAAQEELNRLVGRELNANSPKQVANYLYIEKGIPAYYNKAGGVTTDDKALQRIARGTAKRAGLREAHLIQDIRGYGKLYGTYLDIDFDSDGRLRCAYNPRGTKFGRISSSATVFRTGTNLQNLPQEFKKFLEPDQGYFFWEVDKRQAEWVVVAYLSGDANMVNAIESGTDVHVHTASLMFNLPSELIIADHELVSHSTSRDEILSMRMEVPELANIIYQLPSGMSARQMGKKSNHGLNYDLGFMSFALHVECEPTEAKRIVNLYHSIYPGIRQWHEYIKRTLAADRTLTNCFGRKIRFLEGWGDNLFKDAYSAIPQSTVADNTNDGMIKIYNSPLTDLTGPVNLDIMAQVHDSVLMQVPISILKDNRFYDVAKQVYDYMEPELEYNGRKFKIGTDSKIGFNWGGRHKDKNPKGMTDIVLGNNPDEFMQTVRATLNGTKGA